MNDTLVMTVIAEDRPGIVQALSGTVADHEGNWLESRMARMAGQFAGILRVECPAARTAGLLEALAGLKAKGLSIEVRRQSGPAEEGRTMMSIDVVGNDRPGIVRALSAAVARLGANVEELHTALESAAMAGHPLFHAKGLVALPADVTPGALTEAIEDLGEDLAVTVEAETASDV